MTDAVADFSPRLGLSDDDAPTDGEAVETGETDISGAVLEADAERAIVREGLCDPDRVLVRLLKPSDGVSLGAMDAECVTLTEPVIEDSSV